MTTKNAKTVLLASMIFTMLLPFGSMNFVEAQTTEESAYITEIKNQATVEQMNEEQRNEFIQKLQEEMNATEYEREVYTLLEDLNEVNLQIIDAQEQERDTTDLVQQGWAIVYDLEDYGVVSEDRLLSNPDYWHNKADEARKQIQNGETVQATVEIRSNSNIQQVHTDNVSLKNQSEVDYLCGFFLGVPIYCPRVDVAWGGGTDTHAIKTLPHVHTQVYRLFRHKIAHNSVKLRLVVGGPEYILPHDGRVYTEGSICLHNDGGHDRVNFRFDTEHDVYTILGGHVFDIENGPSTNYLNNAGTCAKFTEQYNGISAVAGSTAHTETHLDSNIWVTG